MKVSMCTPFCLRVHFCHSTYYSLSECQAFNLLDKTQMMVFSTILNICNYSLKVILSAHASTVFCLHNPSLLYSSFLAPPLSRDPSEVLFFISLSMYQRNEGLSVSGLFCSIWWSLSLPIFHQIIYSCFSLWFNETIFHIDSIFS